MKKLSIVILSYFFTLGIQAQTEINIIYVDLNKLNYEEDYIVNIIEPIIENPFVLFISNGSKYSFIDNKTEYQKNPDSLFTQITERPVYSYDLNVFNAELEKSILKNYLMLGNSTSSDRQINLFFISDKGTFCNYEMHKYLVNNMMLLYNFRNKTDIFSNCQINYFLKNNSDKTCNEVLNSKQINLTIF
jgi:hypothetical protein